MNKPYEIKHTPEGNFVYIDGEWQPFFTNNTERLIYLQNQKLDKLIDKIEELIECQK